MKTYFFRLLFFLIITFGFFSLPTVNAQSGSVISQYSPSSGFSTSLTFSYRFGSVVGQAAVWIKLSNTQTNSSRYQYQGKIYESNKWTNSYSYEYLDLEVTFGQIGNTITRSKRIFPKVGNDEIQFSAKSDFGIEKATTETLNTFRVFSIRVSHHYSQVDDAIITDIKNQEHKAKEENEKKEPAKQAQQPQQTQQAQYNKSATNNNISTTNSQQSSDDLGVADFQAKLDKINSNNSYKGTSSTTNSQQDQGALGLQQELAKIKENRAFMEKATDEAANDIAQGNYAKAGKTLSDELFRQGDAVGGLTVGLGGIAGQMFSDFNKNKQAEQAAREDR